MCHVAVGQEAVAVGVCAALEKQDYITSTHRGHGHLIARGGDIKRMMAELMGKETGYCKGRGGSMHMTDITIGHLGANGIVGGHMGIAVGAGLYSKISRNDAVTVAFFGDELHGVHGGRFPGTVSFSCLLILIVPRCGREVG